MSNKPYRVIFSPEEVRAYMAGRKTQFRRVVKLPESIDPDEYGEALWELACNRDGTKPGEYTFVDQCHPTESYPWIVECPFGRPGDTLWVAETWSEKAWSVPDFAKLGMGDRFWKDTGGYYCGETLKIVYRADGECKHFEPWKASITMPRHASRLGPVVTEVRVQQVQDISEEDCWADGILREFDAKHYVTTDSAAHAAFATRWDSCNAKHGHGWDANHWVWAVTVTPHKQGNEND